MNNEKYPDYLCDEDGELIILPAPYPVPNIDVYENTLKKSLNFDVNRKKNYEKYLQSSKRNEVIEYQPTRLDIENVRRCNFACQMCMVSTWDKRQRARDLELKEFKEIIDNQVGLVEVKIQGFGEPTMQRNVFYEMIKYARMKELWVRTVTNASLLHLKDNYKKLIDSGVNEIQISIDGATKEVFESIRHGSVFDMVVSNCKLINEYAASKGVELTKMWTVVQRKNQHQIKELIDLGKEIGFKHLVFSLNLVDFGVEEIKQRNASESIMETVTNRDALKYIEYGDSLGLNVRFWRQTGKYSTKSPDKLCPWPFERAFISSDSRIVPCCVIGNPEVADFGSAIELSEIWNSKVYKDFRNRHLSGDIPSMCKDCYCE